MKKILIVTLLTILFIAPPAHSYTNFDTFKIGQFMAAANGYGVAWFKKKDGSNFPGCGQSIMWQASSAIENDPAGVFTPTDFGLEATMATILLAKGLDTEVTVYYHVGVQGFCRYELIVAN